MSTLAAPTTGGTRRFDRPGLRLAAPVLALLVAVASPTAVFAWDANSFSAADEQDLVTLTNQSRAAAGKAALTVDPALTEIARWRSQDMIERDYFSHSIPPNGTNVFDEMTRRGYCYTVAGENIGYNNFPDDIATETIHQGFMDSPGHRANILGDWKVIGVGAYKGADGKHMWTVLFAKKCGSSPTPGPTPAPTPKPTPKPTPAPTPKPPAASPDPTVAPTTAPPESSSPAPTATPAATPAETPDPAEGFAPRVGSTQSGGGRGGPAAEPPGEGPAGFRVVDLLASSGLVGSVVSDVTGAYFGF